MSGGFDLDRNRLSAKLDELKVVKGLAIEEFEELYDALTYELEDVFVKDLDISRNLKDFMRVSRELLLLENRESEMIYKFISKYADDLDFFDEGVDYMDVYGYLLDAYNFCKSKDDDVGKVFFKKKIVDLVKSRGDDLIGFKDFFKNETGDVL